MATVKPNKALAEALTIAKKVSAEGVIKHNDLETKYIEVLKRAGFLTPVIRGWYLLNKPEVAGTSTVWYVGFWPFLKSYLADRFGKQGYCLSADASLDLHVGQGHIARQITAITQKASNQSIQLPHETSLLLYADNKNYPAHITKIDGIYAMTLPLALCRLSPSYFKSNPLNVEIALKMLPSVSDISRILLETGLVTDAGRIAGAFRAIEEPKKADQIKNDMSAAGFEIIETNPFENHTPVFEPNARFVSPYVGRIQALWKQMREEIIEIFPKPSTPTPQQGKKVIRIIEERYSQDAYHSLSIEGYEVTEELIEKIANECWNPEVDQSDRDQLNAMAAKGYYDAFQDVLKSVVKVLNGSDPGRVCAEDLQTWYRKLFSPGVKARILKAPDLAGYRDAPVYIRGARHVPPRKEAVLDAMETLFSLLEKETHPAVKAVLGHFIFVYIHPYMDGNGRIARFLLNLMLISGGYTWTVIRKVGRDEYMASLEAASIEGKIGPFAKFVKSEMDFWTKQNNK